ncbi:MAG: M48 family metallopeptidase [bacterium]|nr:M48 family metallopeptidase [bacterium]
MSWLRRLLPFSKHEGMIDIEGRSVCYVIKKNSQSRRIRAAISSDEIIRVTMPTSMKIEEGIFFLQKNQEWVLRAFNQQNIRPHIALPLDAPSRKYHRIARKIVLKKILQFNDFYHFPYASVRIKDMRTRWGSCSKIGNLNFNYKLQFLPLHLVDYIVVHELCHLQELNHGKEFWHLVSQCIPDGTARRKELREINVR